MADTVMLMQQADTTVIGNNQTVEPPLFTQDFRQQEVIAVARLTINVVICRHHRTGIRQLHRHLKRQQESVIQLAKTKMNRRMVARPFAERVPDIMFQRGQQVPRFAL